MPLTGDWKGALKKLEDLPNEIRRRAQLAVLRAVVYYVSKVREGLLTQAPGGKAFQPLHPFTLAQRPGGGEGGKRLIDHADLLGAIAYSLAPDGLSGRVGVQRKVVNGKDLVNIARVQSTGAVIAVTQRMRAYLHGEGLHLKASTTHIIIPPSPFLEPVLVAERDAVTHIMQDALRGK